MSEKKKIKKVLEENKELKKSVTELIDQQKEMLRTLKKLAKEKKTKKRKRSEKKKEESRKKAKVDGGLASLQGAPRGSPKSSVPRNKMPRVLVSNAFAVPGQKKGQKLFISDASPQNNLQIYRLIERYQKLPVGKEKTEQKRKLVSMFKEAIGKGHVVYDTRYVPEEILRPSMEEYQKETGKEVTMEFDSSGQSSTSSESEGPSPKESFTGNMEKYVLDLTQKNNSGFVENLANTTEQVADILLRLLKRWRSFKYYLEYAVILERPSGQGADEEMEQRDVKLTSSGEDSVMETVRKKADVGQTLSASFQRLLEALTRYTGQGSNLKFLESTSLSIFASRQVFGITKSVPTDTESSRSTSSSNEGEDVSEMSDAGGSWIPLPAWVRNRGGAINPKPGGDKWRTDERCFEWAILRGLNYPLANPLQKPMDISDLLTQKGSVALPPGVNYPIPLDDRVLSEIERLNAGFSFSIFSIGNMEDECRPLYLSNFRFEREKHLQLGLISSFGKSHFVLIRSMSRLFPASSGGHLRFFCESCLNPHRTRDSLNRHAEVCGKHEPAKVKMPEKGTKDHIIKFDSWRFKLPKPWVIYADFESIIKAGSDEHSVSGAVYSIRCRYQAHEKVLGWNDRPLGEIRTFTGPTALHDFMMAVFEDVAMIEALSQENIPCNPSEEEMKNFKEAKVCHICEKELGPVRDLDHDHYDGKYRGAAHKSCNMQYGASKYFKVPVVFHNLRGYDGYFILRELASIADRLEKIEVIAKNLDKYTCIEVNNVRFMDSMQFINGSLETLVENYRKDMVDEDPREYVRKLKAGFPKIWGFIETRFESFPPEVRRVVDMKNMRESILNSMLQLSVSKGIYPYEYMDSYERLDEKMLPPKEAFFSKLRNEGISDKDYEKAQRVWRLFRCKDMRDYTVMYNTLDVLQLEVLFEAFRESCLAPKSYGLDPAHFITAPSLSWYAMLKMNFCEGIVIENLTDVNMLLMMEAAVRGGMCQVFNPYASVKPGGLSEDLFEFNDGLDRRILYLDANNLYGWAMMQPLPIGCWRWEKVGEGEVLQRQNPKDWIPLSEKAKRQSEKGKEAETKSEDPNMNTVELWANEDMEEVTAGLLRLDPLGDWGYMLEVDVDVPERLHDRLNDYPLLPEHKCPAPSPFSQEELERLGMDGNDGVSKLVCDLIPKRNYVIHFRNLIQALELGYELRKVHRVLAFKQVSVAK
jgi:Recombination endonuclease VII